MDQVIGVTVSLSLVLLDLYHWCYWIYIIGVTGSISLVLLDLYYWCYWIYIIGVTVSLSLVLRMLSSIFSSLITMLPTTSHLSSKRAPVDIFKYQPDALQ